MELFRKVRHSVYHFLARDVGRLSSGFIPRGRYDGNIEDYFQNLDDMVDAMISRLSHGRRSTGEDLTSMRQRPPRPLEDGTCHITGARSFVVIVRDKVKCT